MPIDESIAPWAVDLGGIGRRVIGDIFHPGKMDIVKKYAPILRIRQIDEKIRPERVIDQIAELILTIIPETDLLELVGPGACPHALFHAVRNDRAATIFRIVCQMGRKSDAPFERVPIHRTFGIPSDGHRARGACLRILAQLNGQMELKIERRVCVNPLP